MDDLYQGESGQIYVKLPGNKYRPVTTEQASFIRENGLQAFKNAALNSLAQIPVGAASIFAEQARPHFQQLQAEQQARALGSPLATFAGGVAPDVAAGLVTGGTGSLARRMATTGLIEGALGATRNPENPIGGAALQGGLGAAAVPVGLGAAAVGGWGFRRGAALADNVINRSRANRPANNTGLRNMGAAENVSPTFERTQRPLFGLMTPEEADNAGISLTRGERAALGARTPEELAQANRMRDLEDVASSTKLAGTGLRGEDFLPSNIARSDQEQWFTEYLLTKLDQPNKTNLTAAARADIRKDVSGTFDKFMKRFEDDIPTDDFVQHVREITDNAGVNAKPRLEAILKRLEEKLGPEYFKTGEFSTLRNRIARDMRTAFKGGNYELGTALSQVTDALDEALETVVKIRNPDALAELQDARTKWGILKALERVSATDPSGNVNIKSFYNAYRANKPSIRTGSAALSAEQRVANNTELTPYGDEEFARVLETIRYLTSRQTGDSGTAARLIAAGVGAAPASAVGYNLIFGM